MLRRLHIQAPRLRPLRQGAAWSVSGPLSPLRVGHDAFFLWSSRARRAIRVIRRERPVRAPWRERLTTLPDGGERPPRVGAAQHRPHKGSWPPFTSE